MIQYLFSKVEFSWADIWRAMLSICVKVVMNALVIALSIIVYAFVRMAEASALGGEKVLIWFN